MTTFSSSPILYCDVDGVINITKRSLGGAITQRVKRSIPLTSITFPVRLTFREHIIELLKLLPVEWFWLTTWNYDAQRLLEPLTGLKSVGGIRLSDAFSGV